MADQKSFPDLLKAMPEIAQAINHFQSELVQREAFQALIRSWEGQTRSHRANGAENRAKGTDVEPAEEQANPAPRSRQSKARKSRSSASPSIVKDLDLRPKGKESFREFVELKAPVSVMEQCTVAVYYLSHELALSDVSVDHVFTAFRDAAWRIPANLKNSLAQTASKKGWLDTSNMSDIKVTPNGLNMVEHDLPQPPKSK